MQNINDPGTPFIPQKQPGYPPASIGPSIQPTDIKPFPSIRAKTVLDQIHKETRLSLKRLSSLKCDKATKGKVESVMKKIDSLASIVLNEDGITAEDVDVLAECQQELKTITDLVQKFDGAEEITKGLKAAHLLLEDLSEVMSVVEHYQELSQPVLKADDAFYELSGQAPLSSLDPFLELISNLSTLDVKLKDEKQHKTISAAKLMNLHELLNERIELDIDAWVESVKQTVAEHLNQLFYQAKLQDPSVAKEGQAQLTAFKTHLAGMLAKLEKIGVPLPEEIVEHLANLKKVLSSAVRSIEREGHPDVKGMRFGDNQWDQAVAVRPTVPPGLFSRIFSYLNPLEYVPEKWRPSNEQVKRVFLHGMMLSAEAIQYHRRYQDAAAFAVRAKESQQKHLYDTLPPETKEQLEKEMSLVERLLVEKFSKGAPSEDALKKLTKRYPETFEPLNEARQKFQQAPPNETDIKSISERYFTERVQSLHAAAPAQPAAESPPVPTVPTAVPISLEDEAAVAARLPEVNRIARSTLATAGEELSIRQAIQQGSAPINALIQDGINDIVSLNERLKARIPEMDMSKAVEQPANYSPEVVSFANQLSELYKSAPRYETSEQTVIDWKKEIVRLQEEVKQWENSSDRSAARQTAKQKAPVAALRPPVKGLSGVLEAVSELKVEVEVPPTIVEQRFRDENLALITQVIHTPSQALSDKEYANLVGLNTGELKDAKIGPEELEGLKLLNPIDFFKDTQVTYLKALEQHPGFSTACRMDACHAVFGNTPYADQAASDFTVVANALEKLETGFKIGKAIGSEKNEMMKEKYKELKVGESFLFPASWATDKAIAHAVIIEIEKDRNQQILLRVYNLGLAATYHAEDLLGKSLPFLEIVEIEPARIFGGAFAHFLDGVAQLFLPDEEIDIAEKLKLPLLYEIGLGALGGKVSTGEVSSNSLRKLQEIGNCGTFSTSLALDKTYLSTSLAERMRALTLYRATVAYYLANKNSIGTEGEGEARTRLIQIGAKATAEAILRAIEVGGLIGEESAEMTANIKSLLDETATIQKNVFTKLANYTVALDVPGKWSKEEIPLPQVYPLEIGKRIIDTSAEKASRKTIPNPRPPDKLKAPPKLLLKPLEDKELSALVEFSKRPEMKSLNAAAILTPMDFPFLDSLNVDVAEARGIVAALNSPTLAVTELLAWTAKNIENFLSIDRLQILHRLLVDQEILKNNIAADPGLPAALGKFYSDGLSISRLIQDVELSAYFVYLSRTTEQMFKEIGTPAGAELKTSHLPDSAMEFRAMIAEAVEDQDKNALKILHFHRLKSFELHIELTDDESAEVLASVSYLRTHADDALTKEMVPYSELIQVAASHLKQQDRYTAILNALAKDIDPQHVICEWYYDKGGKVFYSDDLALIYSPTNLILETQVIDRIPPPVLLSENPLYQTIVKDPYEPLPRIASDVFFYNDDNGVRFRFVAKDEDVHVFREINGKWFEAIQPELESTLPESLVWPLYEGAIFWASVDKSHELYVTNIKNSPDIVLKPDETSMAERFLNTLKAKWRAPWVARPLTASMQPENFFLVEPVPPVVAKHLSRIEDVGHTLVFSKEQKISRIVLPKYHLNFEASEQNPALLASKELDGFGIYSGYQGEAIFEDFIGFLPLKKIDSKTGEQHAILVPDLPFSRQKSGVLTTPTAFALPEEPWNTPSTYFLYKYDGVNLVPIADTKEALIRANVHLAGIFLSERNYREAKKYLKEADLIFKSTPARFSPFVTASLAGIVNFYQINGDVSPDAAAIRLAAAAMIQRINALGQSTPRSLDIANDYDSYSKRVNRVDINLRLSKEEARLAHECVNAPKKEEEPKPVTKPELPKTIELAIGISKTEHPVKQTELHVSPQEFRYQASPVKFKPVPSIENLAAHELILTLSPLFLNAFPTDIIPLYRLMRDPLDLGNFERKKLAKKFGLDETLKPEEIRKSFTTLIQLRYRYLNGLLQALPNDKSAYDRQMELQLLTTLLNAPHGRIPEADLDEQSKKHRDLVGALREAAGHNTQIKKYEEISSLPEESRAEALKLWVQWVQPYLWQIPLTVEKSTTQIQSFTGPVLTDPVINVPSFNYLPFALREESLQSSLPQNTCYFPLTQTITEQTLVDSAFTAKEIPVTQSQSPFAAIPSNPFAAKVISEVHERYATYLKAQPKSTKTYTLTNPKPLKVQAESFKGEVETLKKVIAESEESITALLNKKSTTPTFRSHLEANLVRRTARPLTLADAKIAFAHGWDREYLLRLNPNLTAKDFQILFGMTFGLLVQQREMQRRERIISSIETVLNADPKEQSWDFYVDRLMKSLGEKLEYDPHDNPLLLLAETEFDLALWSEQIPAIARLAPNDQAAALVELAMGLGKSDVITPVILTLFADKDTLPILVMPDSLLPSFAPQLQKRVRTGFNIEIRSIPIDRGHWTLGHIKALVNELTAMKEQRIPLVWSSSDVQTLVNSFLEDADSIAANPLGENEIKRINAWRDLFGFLRDSAKIIGDEIHAIMDILTTYNFALGTAKKLEPDEMDSMIHFIQTVLKSPYVEGKLQLPFAGKTTGAPLTQENFDTMARDGLIKTLMDDGITSDSKSIELFRAFEPKKKQIIIDYLSSKGEDTYSAVQSMTFFSALDSDVIDRWDQGAIKPKDKEAVALLDALLPSDRNRIQTMLKAGLPVAFELKKCAVEYGLLNKKILNFLAIQKESLRSVFVLTSNAQLGKHYAINRDKTSAIPSDNGTPLHDSQFGTSIERLYYTAFLIMQSKVSKEIVSDDLDKFLEKYRSLVLSIFEDNPQLDDISLQDHPLVKAFHGRYGNTFQLNESGFDDDEIAAITEWVNSDIERQIPFIRDYYFEEIDTHPREVETTTHIFPLLAKPGIGLRGTTGTLYNRPTYPNVFKETFFSDTLPVVSERIRSTSGRLTATASLSGEPAAVIDNLYSHSTAGPVSIIDTTGYLQKERSGEYAKRMLERCTKASPKIKAVAFYEGDVLKVLKQGADQPTLFDPALPRESLVVLWDVAHTTGSNIIIDPTATAQLIVGKHLRLFELGQAAMRLRGLGSGQKMQIIVSDTDKQIISERLEKYLGAKVDLSAPLTPDQILQYAMINEAVEESENNWRAIDMRMRMAVIEPILLNVIWNPAVPEQQAIEAFKIAKGLFIQEKNPSTWGKYGASINKVQTAKAKAARLESWLNNPLLQVIRKNPSVFPGVDVDAIVEKIRAINAEDPGPLQEFVDSEKYLGKKQKVMTKTQIKTKTHVKQKVRTKEKTKLHLHERKKASKPGNAPPPRRKPYHPLPVIPIGTHPFDPTTYQPTLALQEVQRSTYDQLLANPDLAHPIPLAEIIQWDPDLKEAVKTVDPKISLSLNLIAGSHEGSETDPMRTPYDYLSKVASHALIVHDKATDSLRVVLLDLNDAQAYAKVMEEDRKSPEKATSHPASLTLYDLRSDRAIASGAEQAYPSRIPSLAAQANALLAEAKLLTGMTQYTKEQQEILKAWMSGSGRSPEEILRAYVTRVAFNQEDSVSRLPRTPLGKIFVSAGITKEHINTLVRSEEVKNTGLIRSLIYDLSLTPKERIDILEQVRSTAENQQFLATRWSDVLTPLLPLSFDLLYMNGVASRINVNDPDAELSDSLVRAAIRRMIMSTFYTSIGDVFGAWKTAVPQMQSIELPTAETLAANKTKAVDYKIAPLEAYGNDADVAAFMGALNCQIEEAVPFTATDAQLETMSELAHPLWGLPAVTDSKKLGGEYPGFAEKMQELLGKMEEPELKSEYFDAVPSRSFGPLANAIASHAIGHIKLTESLKDLSFKTPDYPFERLYGIFAYLAKQGNEPDARREYALLMLPRLFAGSFQDDMRYYTDFIPKSLTIETDKCTPDEIRSLLFNCYLAFIDNKFEYVPIANSTELAPSTLELTLALRDFAMTAPTSVAKVTGEWMNEHLKTASALSTLSPTGSIFTWTNHLAAQLFARKEPLIDHALMVKYFPVNAKHLMHITHELRGDRGLSDHNLRVLEEAWKLNDFDLYNEAAQVPSLDKPEFTPYEIAAKWTRLIDKYIPASVVKLESDERYLKPDDDLWNTIIDPVAKAVSTAPPETEQDLAVLEKFLDTIDRYSGLMTEEDFFNIQDKLAPIRLAYHKASDIESRRAVAMEKIKGLPFDNPLQEKIDDYFIFKYLIKPSVVGGQPGEAALIPMETMEALLTDLNALSEDPAHKNHPWFSKYDWFNMFNRVTRPFTLNGTEEQKAYTFNWINSVISTPERTPFMKASVISLVISYPERIQHQALINYVEGYDEKHFIKSMVDNPDATLTLSDALEPYARELGDLCDDDFELFAELAELKTANRIPFDTKKYADKLTSAIEKNPMWIESPVLRIALGSVYKVGKESPDNESVLKLVDTIEKQYNSNPDLRVSGSALDELIHAVNNLRMVSQFSDRDPNKNLVDAVVDYFTPTASEFRTLSYPPLVRTLKDLTKDTAWTTQVMNRLQDSIENKLDTNQEKMIKDLFEVRGTNLLPATVNTHLNQGAKVSAFNDALLSMLSREDRKSIDYLAYRKYLEDPNADRTVIFSKLGVAELDTEFMKRGNFGVIAQVLDLNLKNQPQLALKDITMAIRELIDGDKESQNRFLDRMVASLDKYSYTEQSNKDLASPIIELMDESGIAVPTQLRLRVDFSDNANKNFVKTFDYLLLNEPKKRTAIYAELLQDNILPSVASDNDLIVQSLNKLTAASGLSPTEKQGLFKTIGESILFAKPQNQMMLGEWLAEKGAAAPSYILSDYFKHRLETDGWRMTGAKIWKGLSPEQRIDAAAEIPTPFTKETVSRVNNFDLLLETAGLGNQLSLAESLETLNGEDLPYAAMERKEMDGVVDFVLAKMPSQDLSDLLLSVDEATELKKFIKATEEVDLSPEAEAKLDELKSVVLLELTDIDSALRERIEAGKLSEDKTTNNLVQRLTRVDYSQGDHRALASRLLELLDEKRIAVPDDLRMKLDFNATPKENFKKAFDYVMNNSGTYRSEKYPELMQSRLMRELKPDGNFIVEILNQFNSPTPLSYEENEALYNKLSDGLMFVNRETALSTGYWLSGLGAEAPNYMILDYFRKGLNTDEGMSMAGKMWEKLTPDQRTTAIDLVKVPLSTEFATTIEKLDLILEIAGKSDRLDTLQTLQAINYADLPYRTMRNEDIRLVIDYVAKKMPAQGWIMSTYLPAKEAKELQVFVNAVKQASPLPAEFTKKLNALLGYIRVS